MLFLLPLLLATLVTAAPTVLPTISRALSSADVNTLTLALYIKNLEHELFLRGCNGFADVDYQNSGFGEGFRSEVCVIAQQEAFHV